MRESRGSTHTHSPARTGHSDTLARTLPPKRPGGAQSGRTARLRARALTHTGRPWLSGRTEPGSGGFPTAAAAQQQQVLRGRDDALTAAGAPRGRAPCGQHAAAAAACGLFPPFINPAQGTEGGRGRAGSGDPAGGGCAGRGGGRKTSAPAGASLRPCVRGSAAAGSGAGLGAAGPGPRWGRGGLRRGVLRCADPGGRGCSGERGSRHRRRSLPGGGRAAKDTCRLSGLRRAGASAQRPGTRLLRSGGAGSHAIHASAHLRAGRRPWLAAGGGREVA